MKPVILLILALILLTACAACGTQPAPTATLAPPATLSVVETTAAPTSTPLTPDTSTPDPTFTRQPTATRVPPTITSTRTITPLPTIPTFTPTFDARTIVTATPAPKAECPQTNLSLNIELPTLKKLSSEKFQQLSKLDQIILEYFNNGGTIQNLTLAYKEYFNDGWPLPMFIDMTNDTVPEIIVVNVYSTINLNPAIYIFACKNGLYTQEFTWQIPDSTEKFQNLTIKDLNLDNYPELIIQVGHYYPEDSSGVWVYEYRNNSFESMLSIPYPLDSPDSWIVLYDNWPEGLRQETRKDFIAAEGNYKFEIKDINRDNFLELVLFWDVSYSSGPSRSPEIVYAWNGKNFSFYKTVYPSPEYRFQAVQDGDIATHFGEYDKALVLYQDAIFDNKLEWYSLERKKNFDTAALTPTPIPDLTEYPRLAAYAYYRMVILHTFLGEMDAAQVKYATLQEKFPAGNPGQPYAAMASAFWEAYQSTQKMYDGCAAAIGYAAAHPEILTPLGSDYHGAQSHTYVPADVCPFR